MLLTLLSFRVCFGLKMARLAVSSGMHAHHTEIAQIAFFGQKSPKPQPEADLESCERACFSNRALVKTIFEAPKYL